MLSLLLKDNIASPFRDVVGVKGLFGIHILLFLDDILGTVVAWVVYASYGHHLVDIYFLWTLATMGLPGIRVRSSIRLWKLETINQ